MKQLEDKIDSKQETMVELEQTLAQQQFRIAELIKQNHEMEKNCQQEAAHAEYVTEEASKRVEAAEVQIRALNEQLKAAKKSANETTKIEAKRSYSINSKGALSSNAKFTAKTYSSNGSNNGE